MTSKINPAELAREIAEIARTTTDQETGRILIELLRRLLVMAGLPPDDAEGGGEPPSHWVSIPADIP